MDFKYSENVIVKEINQKEKYKTINSIVMQRAEDNLE